MRALSSFLFVMLTVVAVLSRGALADAKSDYAMLFGKEDQKVEATKSPLDDAIFAGKLLAAAKALGDSPELAALVCRRAWTFALRHRGSYDKALAAVALLEKIRPKEAVQWRQWRCKVLALQYAQSYGPAKKTAGAAYLDAILAVVGDHVAADELTEALGLYAKAFPVATYLRSPLAQEIIERRRELTQRLARARGKQTRLKRLMDKVAKNPTDPKARKALILYHLVELDDPAAAAKHITPETDETLRTYIPLAAKADGELAAVVCSELGDWYRTLAAAAPAAHKPAMLLRARAHYQRFLDRHTRRDAAALKVKMSLAAVEKKLPDLPATTLTRPGWREVLPLVNPARHAYKGAWSRSGATIVTTAQPCSAIVVPVAAPRDYELLVTCTRLKGNDGFRLLVPVGDGRVAVVVDHEGGTRSGLDAVDGVRLGQHKVAMPGPHLTTGQESIIAVRVRRLQKDEVRVQLAVNKQPVLIWQGSYSRLSCPDWSGARTREIGMAVSQSTVTVRSFKIRKFVAAAGAVPTVAPVPAVPAGAADKRYRNRTGRNDLIHAKQFALDLIAAKRGTSSEIKALDLIACYDAIKRPMLTTGGRVVKVGASLAEKVLIGKPTGMFVRGPGTAFDGGTYIVYYRIMAMEQVDGLSLCTLDVRADGESIKVLAPSTAKWPINRWLEFGLTVRLGARSKLEFLIWGRGKTLVVDRVYVFQAVDR